MNIFPKCLIGRKPFITVHGYVLPCCWLDIPRYNSNFQIRNEDWELIDNIFIRPQFHLAERSYENIVTSDEWLLALEQLFILKYHPCKMKCSDFFMSDGEVEHNDTKIDEMLISGELVHHKDHDLFNEHLVDTWDVEKIQVELTTRCNLKCPYCPRLTDKPSKSDIHIKQLENVLFAKHWGAIDDVGNYGDSIFYPKYHQFLELMIDANVDLYIAHIAATGRNQVWWNKTIKLYEEVIASGTEVKIFWGIDGLENTSKRHRIGQNWQEITNAMRDSAKAGVNCQWQYIPMSFNEHQIDEAQQMADDWGVNLYVHPSCRFTKDDPNMPSNSQLHRNFYDVRD